MTFLFVPQRCNVFLVRRHTKTRNLFVHKHRSNVYLDTLETFDRHCQQYKKLSADSHWSINSKNLIQWLKVHVYQFVNSQNKLLFFLPGNRKKKILIKCFQNKYTASSNTTCHQQVANYGTLKETFALSKPKTTCSAQTCSFKENLNCATKEIFCFTFCCIAYIYFKHLPCC